MRIASVECHVLLAPNYDPRFTSSAQDSFVVVLRTEDGLEGIGESDVNPWIAKACLEAPGTHTMGLCMKELLLGAHAKSVSRMPRRNLDAYVTPAPGIAPICPELSDLLCQIQNNPFGSSTVA